MHHLTQLDVDASGSSGEGAEQLRRQVLVGAEEGSVHMGFSHLTLPPGAEHSARHHSFELSIYMLAGRLVVELASGEVTLDAGDTLRLPIGTAYALRGDGPEAARWVEMAAPQPQQRAGRPADTFLVDEVGSASSRPEDGDELVLLRAADPKTGDRRSQSVGDAVERIERLSLEMLVEHPFGLHAMFIADAGPGSYLGPHDHPHEEAYLMLEGSCQWTFDGAAYLLHPGDVAWSGVGTIHEMHNVTDQPCRWLETQAPMPAARHAIRYF